MLLRLILDVPVGRWRKGLLDVVDRFVPVHSWQAGLVDVTEESKWRCEQRIP